MLIECVCLVLLHGVDGLGRFRASVPGFAVRPA
jgi:hypothetical protein